MPKNTQLSQYQGQKMKRVNPKTGTQFTRGDRREDGKAFSQYTKEVKKDGFFKEIWVSTASLQSARTKNANHKRAKYPRKTTRLPYGEAHLFKDKPRAIEAYKDFIKNPPTEKDWVWIDDDLSWIRKYFTLRN